MLPYFLRKLFYGLLVLLGVVLLVFILFQGFGDPARLVLGQTGNKATEAAIRKELYLDQSKPQQFLHYLNDISPVSSYTKEDWEDREIGGVAIGGERCLVLKTPYLRRSYQSKRPVGELLLEALPATLLLAFAAMALAVLIGIPLGMLAAVRKGKPADSIAVGTSIIGISAPSFFMAIIIAYAFGFLLSNWTGLSLTGSWFVTDMEGHRRLTLQNLVLPAVTLGIRPLAIITQLTRSAMLDVLQQDYIRTAYANGLSRRSVLWRHALPNALNPVITAVTGWFAELLAGAFFIEYIFGWQGIGKLTVDALEKLDFPVVMGSVLLSATFFILINILADLLYGIVDPRVRVR
ncbi:MAG: ABC transporter permease [Sphingobacteriales bacterium]|nr:MAG: ABC transporter permease [Sphingobacteriales bacterium]